jgi:prolyl-tRNA synthetase
VPHRVVIGERGLKEGNLEYQGRRDTEATNVPAEGMVAFIKGKLQQ